VTKGYCEEWTRSYSCVSESSLETVRSFWGGTGPSGCQAFTASHHRHVGWCSWCVLFEIGSAVVLPDKRHPVAAFVCTRTDDELRRQLVPALADKITACEDPMKVWLKRAWQTGARFDTVDWARKACFFTMVPRPSPSTLLTVF
jgi:hypothetical protein